MSPTLPASIEAAKAQAKRLRTDLAASGTQISHSQSLELVAHQYGCRDWNTIHAALGNRQPGPPITVGQTVGGQYLGRDFRGEVLSVRRLGDEGRFRITVRFDEPVNVSGFDSFEVLRRQVSATVDRQGRTAEKTSNGLPQMALNV